jgi:hypothetical protein
MYLKPADFIFSFPRAEGYTKIVKYGTRDIKPKAGINFIKDSEAIFLVMCDPSMNEL